MNDAQHDKPAIFLLGTLEIGGSETKFVRLANRLRASGMPVHIAYLRPPDALLDMIDGVPTIHLEQTGKWSQRAYRNLRDYVQKHSIRSIVNVNLYPLTYSVPLTVFNKRAGITNIVSINTSEIRSRRDRAFMLLYGRLLRSVDKLVFGSTLQMESWVSEFRLPARRSAVLYNGVDGQYFSSTAISRARIQVREELGIPSDAFVIACVSQFRPEKGQKNLIRAVGELQDKHDLRPFVLLVGDGAERQAIADRVNASRLNGRVIFAGAVPDVRPYLEASDLFVLPSTAVETFSNAALEAAAMGVPAVISDLGGAREMFPESSSGVVYRRNSVKELSTILAAKVRAGQPAQEMRAAVRKEILDRFDVRRMTDDWISTIWPDCRRKAAS